MKNKKLIKAIFGVYLLLIGIILLFTLPTLENLSKNDLIFNQILVCLILILPSCFLILPIFSKSNKNITTEVEKVSNDDVTIETDNVSINNTNLDNMFSAYSQADLNNIKNSLTRVQINDSLRILSDCIDIITHTSNLETFFSRYNLAMTHITNLELYKYAGIVFELPMRYDDVANFKNEACRVLQASYNKELDKINELKTNKGKINHIDKYIELLKEYEFEFDIDFSTEYEIIITSLETLKANLK